MVQCFGWMGIVFCKLFFLFRFGKLQVLSFFHFFFLDEFFRLEMFLAQWDADDELASVVKLASLLAFVVAGRDGSVVQFYQRAGQVESDASADVAVGGTCRTLVKSLEDGLQLVLRDANSIVLDGDTGQGATPEYAMNYLLDANGVADCTLEFHSEASEIAALLKEDPNRIAVLPQPFVTAAEAQNDQLKTAFSLTDEWDKVTDNGSRFLTGATIVRKAFLEEHPDAAAVFLREQEASADEANTNVEGTAALVAEYGIIEKAPIAQKALPYCNIVCITGEDMKTALSGYLEVLYQADPSSVGGSLPADDFYDIAD